MEFVKKHILLVLVAVAVVSMIVEARFSVAADNIPGVKGGM